MGRALLILHSEALRRKAIDWITRAPKETRVTFQGPQRTLPQNNRMWAMLTDISTQAEHFGRKYSTEKWKCIFLSALGQEMEFVPSLDGKSFIPIGHSSSNLSIQEMTDMIELMHMFGAEHSVVFHEPAQSEAA